HCSVPDRIRRAMRTSRKLLISALTIIVLTVAAVPLINLTVYTPARAAEAYIDALEDGDAQRAFSYLSAPTPSSTLALSSEVLSAAPDLPREPEAETVSVDGEQAKVRLSYNLSSQERPIDLTMVKLPASAGLFDRWAIEQKEWPTLALDVSRSSAPPVNGYGVRGGSVPGPTPASSLLGFDATSLDADSECAEATAPGAAPSVERSPEPTAKLEDTVTEQVTEHLEDCVKAKTLMPAGCVFGYDTDNEIIGDISWS